MWQIIPESLCFIFDSFHESPSDKHGGTHPRKEISLENKKFNSVAECQRDDHFTMNCSLHITVTEQMGASRYFSKDQLLNDNMR